MKQVYKALQWVVANADKYGLDLDNFVISGDSAGGHLSMVTINCQNHPEYREHLGLPDVDIKIKGAILNCPAIDFEGKIINLPVIRTMTYHCTGIKHYKNSNRSTNITTNCRFFGRRETLPPSVP